MAYWKGRRITKKEKNERIGNEAKNFIIDHEKEIDYIPLCLIARAFNNHHKYLREIYNDFNKLNKEIYSTLEKVLINKEDTYLDENGIKTYYDSPVIRWKEMIPFEVVMGVITSQLKPYYDNYWRICSQNETV